jgi:hypothetical protein
VEGDDVRETVPASVGAQYLATAREGTTGQARTSEPAAARAADAVPR